MNQVPTGVLVLFATTLLVAIASFKYVRRWWLAALVALAGAPVAFVLVCTVFNAMGDQQPSVADLLPLSVITTPGVLLVGAVVLLVRWVRRVRALKPREGAR